MDKIKGMKMTKQGLNILSQALLGAQILFTRVALGDGDFDYETESVLDISSMRNWRKDLPITELKIVGNGTVNLVCKQDNADITEGFFCKEYGVFATDPADGEEKLYSYVNFGDEASFLPNNMGPVIEDLKVAITTVIQNAENITAVLNESFAYTARDDFLEHVNSEHPHPNIPNHLDDVTDADNFWVTRNDDHLHKISVEFVKQVLDVDKPELKMLTADKDLGLYSNVLLFEDFHPSTELDEFICKVLSSTKNGRLIGIESTEGIVKGNHYWISDGVNQELIQITGVSDSADYCRATLASPLAFKYTDAKLYRTTFYSNDVDKRFLKWMPRTVFNGIKANVDRDIYADTSLFNIDAVKIEGDGYMTQTGFMTLNKDFKEDYSSSEGNRGSEHAGGITYEEITESDVQDVMDGKYDSAPNP